MFFFLFVCFSMDNVVMLFCWEVSDDNNSIWINCSLNINHFFFNLFLNLSKLQPFHSFNHSYYCLPWWQRSPDYYYHGNEHHLPWSSPACLNWASCWQDSDTPGVDPNARLTGSSGLPKVQSALRAGSVHIKIRDRGKVGSKNRVRYTGYNAGTHATKGEDELAKEQTRKVGIITHSWNTLGRGGPSQWGEHTRTGRDLKRKEN